MHGALLAASVINKARAAGVRLAVAESCTGGLIAAALTDIAGASDVFTHGFVTYANAAKVGILGVPMRLIASHGAVSREVASAMALGALQRSDADMALAVTGIAGPASDDTQKPIGLVYIAVATSGRARPYVQRHHFRGDRATIRALTVRSALRLLITSLPCPLIT